MASQVNIFNELIAETIRNLQERAAQLEEWELGLKIREQKMEDRRARCIEILSTTLNSNSTNVYKDTSKHDK
jgi:2C-methyl-D-erythritol 2,4-cyclodiphosphate synthase